MTRTACTDVCVFQGPVYQINTEDGPQTTADWFIGCYVGRDMYAHHHNFGFQQFYAEQAAEVVAACGSINLQHWVYVEPYNHEDAVAYDIREENDDRANYGAELIAA
jgi:hypothetical protein